MNENLKESCESQLEAQLLKFGKYLNGTEDIYRECLNKNIDIILSLNFKEVKLSITTFTSINLKLSGTDNLILSMDIYNEDGVNINEIVFSLYDNGEHVLLHNKIEELIEYLNNYEK